MIGSYLSQNVRARPGQAAHKLSEKLRNEKSKMRNSQITPLPIEIGRARKPFSEDNGVRIVIATLSKLE
jgi:hypothetical protein